MLALSNYWVEMFQPAPSTPWEGFSTCLSEPCYIRQPHPYPDPIPTAVEKHWEWQPCLLPCCHCNTRDSSHSTGAALLCAWSSESSILGLSSVWGHCCPLSLFPGIEAGTALSQQHQGHTAICPCGLYLVQNRLNSHPTFSRESPEPSAQCRCWKTRS